MSRAILVLLASLIGALVVSGCYLGVREVALEGKRCATQDDCIDGFVCVDERCVHTSEAGEGEGAEGAEGEGAGEGEGEGGEGEGGEGEGSEGEGEGATSCASACASTELCVDGTCVGRILPSVAPAALDPLIHETTLSLHIGAGDTRTIDVDDFSADADFTAASAGTIGQGSLGGIAPNFGQLVVFVFHDVQIDGTLAFTALTGTHGVVVVATSRMQVGTTGVIDVSAAGSFPGPGAVTIFPVGTDTGQSSGGGNSMGGAPDVDGSAGVAVLSDPQMVPFVGGASAPGGPGAIDGGGGGGALYLLCEGTITVDGAIKALGGGGLFAGGGAGGSIFLEGRTVQPGTDLDVRGGGGDAGSHGGCDGCASIPPSTPTSGDGAPGRVRVAARGLLTAPPSLAQCVATASLGVARDESSDPAAPAFLSPLGTKNLGAPEPIAGSAGPAGAHIGDLVAMSASGLIVEASAAAVQILTTTVAGDGFSAESLDAADVDATHALVVAGNGTNGAARVYAVDVTNSTFTTTDLQSLVSPVPAGFGKSVAVDPPFILVAEDAGVHAFTGTQAPFVDAGVVPGDFTALGVVAGVAARADSVIVVGSTGSLLLNLDRTHSDATAFAPFGDPTQLPKGQVVATDGHIAVVGDKNDSGCGTDSGVVAIVDIDAFRGGPVAIGFTPVASPNPRTNERFGASVAIDQNRILVGAPGFQSVHGSVYAFLVDPFAGPMPLSEVTGSLADDLGDGVATANGNGISGAPNDNGGNGGVDTLALGF